MTDLWPYARPQPAGTLIGRARAATGEEMTAAIRAGDGVEWTVVTVSGALDRHTASRWRQQLAAAAECGRRDLIVQLDEVTVLDPTGLGVLVGGLRRMLATDRRMLVVASSPSIDAFIRLTGMDQTFRCYPSLDEALAIGGTH